MEGILNEAKEIIAQSRYEIKNKKCLKAYTSKSSFQNDSTSDNIEDYSYKNDSHKALQHKESNKRFTEVRTCNADDSRGILSFI